MITVIICDTTNTLSIMFCANPKLRMVHQRTSKKSKNLSSSNFQFIIKKKKKKKKKSLAIFSHFQGSMDKKKKKKKKKERFAKQQFSVFKKK